LFPLIDRNPQKLVRSAYAAMEADYLAAMRRIYASSGWLSHMLPVI
jgi:hypothetical protein